EAVGLARLDRTGALVVAARLDVQLEAILAVLVELGEDVLRVLPPSQDGEIAGGVRVALAAGAALAVAPELRLEVALGGLGEGVELDPRVDRQPAHQPDALVASPAHAALPGGAPPLGAQRAPVGPELRAVEGVLEHRGDQRPRWSRVL